VSAIEARLTALESQCAELAERLETNNKKAQPDEWVPDPQVCREFGITDQSLWRWDQDPELAKLGFPPKIQLRGHNYRSRRGLEAFKQRMARNAMRKAAEAAPVKPAAAVRRFKPAAE
jgi:hypothetical protein